MCYSKYFTWLTASSHISLLHKFETKAATLCTHSHSSAVMYFFIIKAQRCQMVCKAQWNHRPWLIKPALTTVTHCHKVKVIKVYHCEQECPVQVAAPHSQSHFYCHLILNLTATHTLQLLYLNGSTAHVWGAEVGLFLCCHKLNVDRFIVRTFHHNCNKKGPQFKQPIFAFKIVLRDFWVKNCSALIFTTFSGYFQTTTCCDYYYFHIRKKRYHL